MTMTDAELAEIRERVEKATPGPWVTRPVSELWDGDYEGSNGCNLWLATEWKGAKGPNLGADEMLNQDAEFTAHARQDIPALLDELAAAREIIEWVYAWSQAYPLDVFPEPDKKRAHELLQAGGMSLDAVSASAIRHAVKSIGQDAANYLYSATEDADDRTT